MAFQTGTYTNVHSFITILNAFAVANGWVQDKLVVGSGEVTDGELYLHKGTTEFYSIQTAINPAQAFQWFLGDQSVDPPFTRIVVYGNTGYLGTSAVDSQPGSTFTTAGGSTRRTSSQFITDVGPKKYWLFTNVTNDYIHLVMNSYPGEYNHLGFGKLDKAGVYTGGDYVMATSWDHSNLNYRNPDSDQHSLLFDGRYLGSFNGGFVRADIDTRTWHLLYNSTLDQYARGSFRDNVMMPIQNTFMPRTLSAPLWNLMVFTNRTGGSKNWLGVPQDIRGVSMHLLKEEQEITLDDSSVWLVFPAQSSRIYAPALTNTNSHPYGYAYRKLI